MNEQMATPAIYQTQKEEIRRKLKETAENFVYIGYHLKQIRDNKSYKEDGYADLIEFALKEYGLSKDDTYRFIRINDRYSIGGDSPELDTRFKGIAQTKLSEMLNLPDEDLSLITPETRREDIRELKRFNESAQEAETSEAASNSPLEAIALEFFRPAPNRPADSLHSLLLELLDIITGKAIDSVLTQEEHIQETLNPKGNSTFRAGRYMLFMYDARTGLKYKAFGDPENHQLTYSEFGRLIHLVFTSRKAQDLDPWESVYGLGEPEKPTPAPKPLSELAPEPQKATGSPESKLDKNDYEEKQPKNNFGGEGTREESQLEEEPKKEATSTKPLEVLENPESNVDNLDNSTRKPEDPTTYPQENPEKQEKAPAQLDAANVPDNLKEARQFNITDYPEYIPEGYIQSADGTEIEESEARKRWKEFCTSLNNLHDWASGYTDPDYRQCRSMKMVVNSMKETIEILTDLKETQEARQ